MTVRTALIGSAWVATVLGAVTLVAGVQLGGAGLSAAGFALGFAGLAADIVVYATVGAFLVLRLPGNVVGLVMMAAAIVIVVAFLGFVFGTLLTTARGDRDGLAGLAALLGGLGFIPALILAGPALALVFPTGHLPGQRWRLPVRAIAVAVLVGTALTALRSGPVATGLADNPLGVTGVPWLGALSEVGMSLTATALPVSFLVALASVVVRFRRARDAEREQLKWFVAANVMVAVFIAIGLGDGSAQPTAFDVLGPYSLSLPPIAVGIAILRYRLYEIDRIISRTIAYAIVTSILVATFGTMILLLQAILWSFTQGQTIAVAASTLAVFGLFQPVLRRVRRRVDRRFDRARYDAERTVDAFGEWLAGQVDIRALETGIIGALGATVRPRSAAVWMRPRNGHRLESPTGPSSVTIPGPAPRTVTPI